jgi:hypothetical protein
VSTAAAAPGLTIDGFRLERVLGRGQMSVVFEANQISLDRAVALKLLTGDLVEDDHFVARFHHEYRLQASLEHPHVLTVYAAGRCEHGLYLATRLVSGPTLEELERGGQLPAGRAIRLLGQVARALDAAHSVKLTHRNLAPRNVLIGDDDWAYLSDFGLTRDEDGSPDADRQAFAAMLGQWVGGAVPGNGLPTNGQTGDPRAESAVAMVEAAAATLGEPAGVPPPRLGAAPPNHGADPSARSPARRWAFLLGAGGALAVGALGASVLAGGGAEDAGTTKPEVQRSGDRAGAREPQAPAQLLTGADAAGAPSGREVAEQTVSRSGWTRRLAVVAAAQGVALDLFNGPRRVARLTVPKADPKGELVDFSDLEVLQKLTWSNPDDPLPVVRHYRTGRNSIELIP